MSYSKKNSTNYVPRIVKGQYKFGKYDIPQEYPHWKYAFTQNWASPLLKEMISFASKGHEDAIKTDKQFWKEQREAIDALFEIQNEAYNKRKRMPDLDDDFEWNTIFKKARLQVNAAKKPKPLLLRKK